VEAFETSVYILDISYEVHGSEPQIIIWGIDESGRRVVLKDKGFAHTSTHCLILLLTIVLTR